MTRCEDYPCCGHTDGLGCNWTYTPEARAFDLEHAMCDHENGFCDTWEADPDEHHYMSCGGCSMCDDDTWCYACDQAECFAQREEAPTTREEVTTPREVYSSEDDFWLD